MRECCDVSQNVDVLPDWKRLSTKQVLETELSISAPSRHVEDKEQEAEGAPDVMITIPALSIPEVSDDAVEILRTVNGPVTLLPGRHDADDGYASMWPLLRLAVASVLK